jgi:hypothetical protein
LTNAIVATDGRLRVADFNLFPCGVCWYFFILNFTLPDHRADAL